MSVSTLPITSRLWLWLTCLFRVLFDGAFAARVWQVRERMPSLPPAAPSEPPPSTDVAEQAASQQQLTDDDVAAEVTPALLLLALLQREGRLVDFLEQDVSSFEDSEVGVAARVVHEGCRKALRAHAEVVAVREEEEDSRVAVSDGLDRGEVKLTGNVTGKPPYRGLLRHKGWRVLRLQLPSSLQGHDPTVVAPAEVEL